MKERKLRKQERGSITVFLSMILICIVSLMCALLRSAQAAGSGWYLQMALNSSMDSLMSKYHREAWERYHLLLLETEGEEELSEEFSDYLNLYLENDAVYGLEPEETRIKRLGYVTDDKGKPLEEEILSYMEYGVWTELGDEASLKELSEVIRSADGIHAVKENYQINSEQVFQLEEILEDIQTSLKKQEEYLEECREELKECRGNAFIRTAEKLSGEMERMPALKEKYEKAAELLEQELDKAEREAEEKREEIGESAWAVLKAQMDSYRAYTEDEGERKQEVEQILRLTEENRMTVKATIEEAKETQEYIDNWESDDDDELDEEELWEGVLSVLEKCRIPDASYKTGIADRERLGILEQISRMASGTLLSMVLPDRTEPSEREIWMDDFPSGGEAGYRIGIDSLSIQELLDRALIDEYIAAHFLKFQGGEEAKGQGNKGQAEAEEETGSRLIYEQEYILNGEKEDGRNLSKTVAKLLAVREGMNLIHILGDSEKKGEARLLASALTGAASVTPIADIVAFFIMGVWAFAESVEDLRALLAGESVPLIKGKEDWKLSLDEIFHFVDNSEKISDSGGKSGLSYGGYLKGFLLLQESEQRNERIMDLIQYNLSEEQEGFQMNRCAVSVEAECTAKGNMFSIRKDAGKEY